MEDEILLSAGTIGMHAHEEGIFMATLHKRNEHVNTRHVNCVCITYQTQRVNPHNFIQTMLNHKAKDKVLPVLN
jgi:hypothetical protein